MLTVEFIKLDPGAQAPRNAYNESAGWDLFCLQDQLIPPGNGVDLRTGLAMALPDGYFARIVGRSSALRKRGLLVVEGIIDPGFRGELFSYVFNPSSVHPVWVHAGDSVAQLIVHKIEAIRWRWAGILPPSERGERGFGSSDEQAAVLADVAEEGPHV
jgi:dUTP pyrophosphatase